MGRSAASLPAPRSCATWLPASGTAPKVPIISVATAMAPVSARYINHGARPQNGATINLAFWDRPHATLGAVFDALTRAR